MLTLGKYPPLPRARREEQDLSEPVCELRVVLDHLTSRWGVLSLIVLLEGTHRFSELRRRIGGVSEKMLAQTLQTLEMDGFVVSRCRSSRPTWSTASPPWGARWRPT
jgi:DNA-binding HxlR family transcriptional regulator